VNYLRRLRYMVDRPASGAVNMARDEALAASVGSGAEGALRVYSFDPPCVSYGRSQEEPGTRELTDFAAEGVEVVRRPTGGLSLLHMDDFTYCLALPTSTGIDREECFALAAAGITGALALLDIPSAVSRHEPAGRRARWCFESAFGVDIESRGRKVCGSAQRVYHGSILQHGTLILSGRGGVLLESLGRQGAGAVLLPLDEAAGRPVTWDEVRRALEESFSKGIGLELEPARMGAAEEDNACDLHEEALESKGK
jgi:lipoyl(octanoyl) transferase